MGSRAHPFFDGSNLDPPLSELVTLAADLAEALSRLQPEHELLEFFTHSGEDHEEVVEAFQIRFGLPGASRAERYTLRGQHYFWQKYTEAFDAAIREDRSRAQDTYLSLVARLIS